jgi:hypothetical protein
MNLLTYVHIGRICLLQAQLQTNTNIIQTKLNSCSINCHDTRQQNHKWPISHRMSGVRFQAWTQPCTNLPQDRNIQGFFSLPECLTGSGTNYSVRTLYRTLTWRHAQQRGPVSPITLTVV